MRASATPPVLSRPPYLPHLTHPQVLQMGLAPLADNSWIETDSSLPQFYAHKLQQRAQHGMQVYHTTHNTLAAQRELAALLLQHLVTEQAQWYTLHDDHLLYTPTNLQLPLSREEPLWDASLWVADDLVLLIPSDQGYLLQAASLCSPSHWRLRDKFGQPLDRVHAPIPGFTESLTPRVDRFLDHLKPEHPVVRFNWSLQADDALHPDPEPGANVVAETPLYYRTERQSLRRLPATGAIAFTIRVYLHPLDQVGSDRDALQALLKAVDTTPTALAHYKGFDRLAPALQKYRAGIA